MSAAIRTFPPNMRRPFEMLALRWDFHDLYSRLDRYQLPSIDRINEATNASRASNLFQAIENVVHVPVVAQQQSGPTAFIHVEKLGAHVECAHIKQCVQVESKQSSRKSCQF